MSTRRDTARRALGQELGGFFVGSASAGSTTTIVTTIPALTSSELPDDTWAYAWVWLPSGTTPQLRRVTKGGLNAATSTLTVDAAFGTAVTNGTIFELSTKLPSQRDLTSTHGETTALGLNEALALALRHLLVRRDDLVLTLVDRQQDYSLSAWNWLDRAERLEDVREPNWNGQTYRSTARTWEFREGAAGHTLHIDQPYRFSTGSYSDRLVALCPADRFIYRGGVWIESTTGPALDADEVAPDLNALVTVGLAFCYRALRDMHKGAARARYAALYADQVRLARHVRGYDESNDIDPSVPAAAPAEAAA